MITVEDIDALLPQTQCRQCGFEGCRAYAEAIAKGLAPINRCAPGGRRGIEKLARLLGVEPLELDPEYGSEVPFAVARVKPEECIGCGWCVKACPTDAVVGAPKRIHGILSEKCTGCALCAPACPMDCIEFVETGAEWTEEDAARARRDHDAAAARRILREAAEARRLEERRSRASGRSASLADMLKSAGFNF